MTYGENIFKTTGGIKNKIAASIVAASLFLPSTASANPFPVTVIAGIANGLSNLFSSHHHKAEQKQNHKQNHDNNVSVDIHKNKATIKLK
jgi:hypothetical protein